MKVLTTMVVLAILELAAPVNAQLVNVQTAPPLLTPGLCTVATGPTVVQNVGCPGRTKTLNVNPSYALANANCGAYITAGGASAPPQVTLPPSPPSGCTFTFQTSDANYFVSTDYAVNPNIGAMLVGYLNPMYQFTLPVSDVQSGFYTLQYDGQEWRTAEFSTGEHESFSVNDGARLANGQVYFQWDSANLRFELFQRNGPGGLIIDGRMGNAPSQVNNQEMWTGIGGLTSNTLYYFYVRHPETGELSKVTETSGTMGQPITLQLSSTQNAKVGDQVYLNCYNIYGTIEANGIWTGTVIDFSHILLNNSNFESNFLQSPNSECEIVQLVASTTGHVTSNRGIEIMNSSDGEHYTLVGECYIGANSTGNDTPTERDCASWYNRGLKTCFNAFTADHTTTSTSYTEVNPEIECEFVTWGTGDPISQTDLAWSINGMLSNNTAGDGTAVTAGFDGNAGPTGPEETGALNPATPVSGFAFSLKGSKSGLSEGRHVITLDGKVINGGTAKFYGSTPVSSLSIAIPQ